MQSAADNAENVDGETTQIAMDCLRTPVILRIIFQRIPSPQLHKLSLVSKLWNYEARIVMRDRGTVTAKMSSDHPCRDLMTFSTDLEQMNVVMFSGINVGLSIACYPGDDCASVSAKELAFSYDVILNRLQWKNLAISFSPIWCHLDRCPAFVLVKKILNGFGSVLEKFSLAVWSHRPDFIPWLRLDLTFASLKVLVLNDQEETTSEEYSNFIKVLVARAPNLQLLYSEGPLNLMENLLPEGSKAVLVTKQEVSPSLDEISDSLLVLLRMTKMKLRGIRQGLSTDRLNMIIPMLLQPSRVILNSIEMDAVFLAPLMCYGIRLLSVRELKIHFSCLEPFRPNILKSVKEFDFTRLFPSLTKVVGCAHLGSNVLLQDQITEMMSSLNPVCNEPMADRAAKIKDLRLLFPSGLQDCPADFLPDMLPHVRMLSVIAFGGEIIPSLVWDQRWLDLKGLKLMKIGSNSASNLTLDSAFCGIFSEEVAELRLKDDEYLKAVNIVPVMPSVACLMGLTSFAFVGDRACFFRPDPTGALPGLMNDPSYMFSKVTGLLAFKKCPDLSVALMTDDSEVLAALEHMKPYARVTLVPQMARNT